MSGYDPSLVHYWDEVKTRGEWPTTVIAPVCTPSERRTVSTEDLDNRQGPCADTDPVMAQAFALTRCPVCVEVMEAMAAALAKVKS